MKTNHYFYDDSFVRYQLVKSNSGISLNWLFIPGGPGADSSYYLTLIKHLNVPGNFWLIDFPDNGTNIISSPETPSHFEKWDKCMLATIQKFDNPIYIGHSFGGMLPLLFPELEVLLKGIILFNAAPTLWLEEAEKYAREHNIPFYTEAGMNFKNTPNSENLKKALFAGIHRHFPKHSVEKGKKIFEQLTINYRAMIWWSKKLQDIQFNAKWIPQTIPSLIMGGSHDFIVPFRVFERDKRFHRKNIQIKNLPEAGHFPWIEQMPLVHEAFESFVLQF